MPKTLEELQEKDMLTIGILRTTSGRGAGSPRRMTHQPDFPLFSRGRVYRIPRDAFLRWLEPESWRTDPGRQSPRPCPVGCWGAPARGIGLNMRTPSVEARARVPLPCFSHGICRKRFDP